MSNPASALRRELGLGGAVVTGLGSILGTGAFVSIGLASKMWGDTVLAAIPLAAAVAFLFVAYTGYGRIATLGEEVHDPRRVIPVAVVVTLAVAATLYMAIEVGGRAMGGEHWGALVELGFIDDPVVKIGAVAAMIGVLVNLVLGLSRVWLAMGRRGDMPARVAVLDGRFQPVAAIVVSGALIAATTLLGDIALAWTFSAMTVLLYYGLTNLSALALDRRRVTGWAGLISCLGLSFFVPLAIWLVGAGLVAAGLAWRRASAKTGKQSLTG